jgi:hypothetical protein
MLSCSTGIKVSNPIHRRGYRQRDLMMTKRLLFGTRYATGEWWYRGGESTTLRPIVGSVSKVALRLAFGLDFDLGSERHPMQHVDARAAYLFCRELLTSYYEKFAGLHRGAVC